MTQKIIDRYNDLMYGIDVEHKTIGTGFSEGTENWNLRDMVAEADYWLGTFYEDGHCNHELIHDDPNSWKSQTGKLKRFIARFKDEALTMRTTTDHCSKYDDTERKPETEEAEEVAGQEEPEEDSIVLKAIAGLDSKISEESAKETELRRQGLTEEAADASTKASTYSDIRACLDRPSHKGLMAETIGTLQDCLRRSPGFIADAEKSGHDGLARDLRMEEAAIQIAVDMMQEAIA